ncbi:epithelial discoidin domain-containing receptor 1-like [Macrobrachium nipponense]|uniref:epithelial discoidin domain-containing receptor 1-like n=1 Tax=Macrobrachium nipponense TaxID=159736 RepID=UPI0030C82EEE
MNYSVGAIDGTYTWSVGAAAGEIISVGEGVLYDGRAGVDEDVNSVLQPTTREDPQLEGLVPAPESPLPLTFTFDEMRRFKAMFLYLTTSNLNAQPKISATVKFGANSSVWDDAKVTWSWSSTDLVPPGPHNLTLDLKKRPGATLQVTLLVSSLEVNILELYFDSTPCGCRLGDWEKRQTTSPEEHTAGRPPEPPADVWAVYTAHQHRTYVGVAVGFSVGVGVLVLVWAGVWLRRRQGKASSPRVFRRPPPDTLDMKSLMEGVGLGVGIGGTITPTYEEGSCLLYDDIQKSPLTSPHNTLPRGRPLTPDHVPVYATPTLRPVTTLRPSSTFPATSTFTSIPRPMTLAALPNPPPPIPPPPENFDRQIKVPAVTGAWLTCVYRQNPSIPSSPISMPTPIIAPQFVSRTQLLASGAFATLSLGVVSENIEASLAEDGNLATPPSSAALITVTAHEAVPAAKRHAQLLATLKHENVASLMGVVLGGVGVTMVMEYHPEAHLPEYLRSRTLAPAQHPQAIDQAAVSVSWLLELAVQIASGMAFLERCSVTHTDLAARNVLILGEVAKITQVGSALPRYSGDYWRSPDGRGPAPLRWISPEALCQGAFSSSSDVWSYGVTLWEILTLARRPPHQHMSHDLLFHALLATHNQQVQSQIRPSSPVSETYATPQLVLMAPTWCPREIQDVMTACWRPQPDQRPSFGTIQNILDAYLSAHK